MLFPFIKKIFFTFNLSLSLTFLLLVGAGVFYTDYTKKANTTLDLVAVKLSISNYSTIKKGEYFKANIKFVEKLGGVSVTSSKGSQSNNFYYALLETDDKLPIIVSLGNKDIDEPSKLSKEEEKKFKSNFQNGQSVDIYRSLTAESNKSLLGLHYFKKGFTDDNFVLTEKSLINSDYVLANLQVGNQVEKFDKIPLGSFITEKSYKDDTTAKIIFVYIFLFLGMLMGIVTFVNFKRRKVTS
jgi:hypothetical protein